MGRLRKIFQRDTTPPGTPGAPAVSISGTTATLSWSPVTDPQGSPVTYRLRRNGTQIATLSGLSYQDQNLPEGSYSWTLQALDQTGNASPIGPAGSGTITLPDTQAPSQVTGLTATPASTSAINLSWAAATDNVGVTGYRLQRATNSGFTAGLVTTDLGNVTTASVTGLAAGTQYFFRVAARDAAGNFGANSPTVNATTQAASEWLSVPSLSDLVVNQAANIPLTTHLASGGVGKNVELEDGALPAGLVIDNTEGAQRLTGTPTTAGSGTFRLRSVDQVAATNRSVLFSGAVTFDNRRIKIPVDSGGVSTSANIGATDFTIECWLKTTAGNNAGAITAGANNNWINGNIFYDRDRYNQNRAFGASLGNGRVCFGLTNATGVQQTWVGTTDIRDGNWHHVAITRNVTSGAVQIFVDGVREVNAASGPTGTLAYPAGATPQSGFEFSDPFLVLGAEKHDVNPSSFPPFYGNMTNLRQSTVIRYTANFTRPTAPFVADANTATLLLMNESSSTVVDSAPTPTNGTLQTGATRSSDTPFADADADWAIRSAGAVRALNFPDVATMNAQGTLTGPNANLVAITPTLGGKLDPNVKVSGANSLRFDFAANSPYPDIAGKYVWNFGEEYGPAAGLGAYQSQIDASVFYVQYKVRMSRSYTEPGGIGQYHFKVSAINYDDNTNNSSVAFVIENSSGRGFPQMYKDAGSTTSDMGTAGLDPRYPSDVIYQQNSTRTFGPTGYWLPRSRWWGNQAQFNQDVADGLVAGWHSDVWTTYYFQFILANNQSTSGNIVRCWIGREGHPLKQAIDWRNFYINTFEGSVPFTPIRALTLLTYITQKTSAQPNTAGSIWYDELIVSRNPIPVPVQNLYTITPAVPAP